VVERIVRFSNQPTPRRAVETDNYLLGHMLKTDPQMAHFVLPDTKVNASQNQKSHFLPLHGQTDRQNDNNSNTFYTEKRDNQNENIILAA
jgi:hypothetical protein